MPSETGVSIAFGLIVIGDEVLNGHRRDRHLAHFQQMLGARGHDLAWHWKLPDEPSVLIEHLRFSLSRPEPVFLCGGIGATPDDHTRACAAAAADRPLVRHPEACRLIEQGFGEQAYPSRIRMADLPAGCTLIPNPYNQIPGFSLARHWFLPGFPQLAWPMAQWVLDEVFPRAGPPLQEKTVTLHGLSESRLVPLMERMTEEWPEVKFFSLPHLGEDPHIVLGVRGHADIEAAFARLNQALAAEGLLDP